MLLESLLECVNEIRERIEAHGDALRKSETQTRYALIDPLLRELGWDTQDPAMVVPEYQSGKGRADYALLYSGKPAMMVEAKSLGTPLQDVVEQGIRYCLLEGTLHFAVTDGRRWEIYETHKPVPIDEKRIVSFDLQGQPAAEVCLQALALWRSAVQFGHVGLGQQLVVGSPSQHETSPPEPQIPSAQPTSQSTDGREWQPMSDWNPEQGDDRPVEIMFPDGSRAPIKFAYEVAVESARWLVDRNILTARHCPITKDNRGRNLVTDNPDLLPDQYPSDKKKVGELYIGVQYNGYIHVRNARTIIKHVGQDPAQFKVRFA